MTTDNQTSSLVINGNEFDCSRDITYSKPRINKNGGKNIPIRNTKSGKQLYLSTPLMMTWGVDQKDFNNNGNFTYSMSLQFPRESDPLNTEKTQAFLENLAAMEEKILTDAVANSKEWFNKSKMSREVLDALWTPMLKYSKGDDGEPDKTRSPNLNIKVPCWDGDFKCELYNLQDEKIFPSEDETVDNAELIQKLVAKTQNVALLIECGGIWFANGKFGVTWRLEQGLVKPIVSLKGRCHIQLDSSELDTLSKSKAPESTSEPASTEVDDSDDEVVKEGDEEANEEVSEEAEPPAPAPAPVKKVVRRKKKAAA
jgi:hypothetical protein